MAKRNFKDEFKKAKAGDPESQNYVACCYKDGFDADDKPPAVKKDIKKSIHWYELAASVGNLKAHFNLAQIYKEGEGVQQSGDKFLEYMVPVAETGDLEAIAAVVGAYSTGLCEQDDAQFVFWLGKAVNHPDARNEEYVSYGSLSYNYGYRQLAGMGCQSNAEEGIRWLRLAMEAGDAQACYEISRYYYGADDFGAGVLFKEDEGKARQLLETSAEKGFLPAQTVASQLYVDGNRGFPVDTKKAFKWCKRAAEQGDNQSMFRLGCMFRDGTGVEANKELSNYWFDESLADGGVVTGVICTDKE